MYTVYNIYVVEEHELTLTCVKKRKFFIDMLQLHGTREHTKIWGVKNSTHAKKCSMNGLKFPSLRGGPEGGTKIKVSQNGNCGP